jgi:hypothetical protein
MACPACGKSDPEGCIYEPCPMRHEARMTECTIWTQSNEGSTVRLFSCAICGASVQRQDKETHQHWHEQLQKLTHRERPV